MWKWKSYYRKKKVFTSCYVKQLTIVTIHRQRLLTFPQFVKLSKLCNDLEIKVIQGKRNTFTEIVQFHEQICVIKFEVVNVFYFYCRLNYSHTID